MSIQIKSCIRTNIEDVNDRESGIYIHGKFLHCEYDFDVEDIVETQIGEIVACQIIGQVDELTLWADSISQDLYDAVVWLQELYHREEDLVVQPHYTFIEKVKIDPAWRGSGITLKAVAAFLEVFSKYGFVFLKPAPLQMLEEPEEQNRQVRRLRRFWRRLKLDHYDPEANYLGSTGLIMQPM